MSRRTNLISNILTFALTIAFCCLAVYVANGRYYVEMYEVFLNFALGAIVAGFVCTAVHELGHLVFGKANGFKLVSLTIWFFRWKKCGKKTVFEFTWMTDSAGGTEMIPTYAENLKKRLRNMTVGGSIFTFIVMLVGLIPVFVEGLSFTVFSLLILFLPIGAYVFFGNILPMTNGGARNDGAVLLGLRKNHDSTTVALNILAIDSELYNGKTPSEIDENLYFDLPQLPEDDLNFAILLNARYLYYLDCGDFENAKAVTDRLLTLDEYFGKEVMFEFKRDALYNACTFDFNEDVADDLMYELEKFLNNNNTAGNVRAKMAYLIGVSKETEQIDDFYKKGVKEAKKHPLKGYGAFEVKLLDELKRKAIKD